MHRLLGAEPHRLTELSGLSLDTVSTDLLLASLNVIGLTPAKLTELLWFMNHRKIDVLVLIDTRCGKRASRHLAKLAKATLGIGSGAYYCGASPPSGPCRGPV